MNTSHVLAWLGAGKEVQVRHMGGAWDQFPGKCSNRFICDVMRGSCHEGFEFRIKPHTVAVITSELFVKDLSLSLYPGGTSSLGVTFVGDADDLADLARNLDARFREGLK